MQRTRKLARNMMVDELCAELTEMKASIRKMTPSTRASALGMATPMLAVACLIGMVVFGKGVRYIMRG